MITATLRISAWPLDEARAWSLLQSTCHCQGIACTEFVVMESNCVVEDHSILQKKILGNGH